LLHELHNLSWHPHSHGDPWYQQCHGPHAPSMFPSWFH
jgi:hypothetical protein